MAIDLTNLIKVPTGGKTERGEIRVQHTINRVTEEFVQLNGRSLLANLHWAKNLYYETITPEYRAYLEEYAPHLLNNNAYQAVNDDGDDEELIDVRPVTDADGKQAVDANTGEIITEEFVIEKKLRVDIDKTWLRRAKQMTVLLSDETEELNRALMKARKQLGNTRSLNVKYEIDARVLPLSLNVNQLTVFNWKVLEIAPNDQIALVDDGEKFMASAGVQNAEGRIRGIQQRRMVGSTGRMDVVGTKQQGGGSANKGAGITTSVKQGLTLEEQAALIDI